MAQHTISSRSGRALVWFRRDLRLHDQTALARACADAESVVPLFVFDTALLGALEDRDDRRVTFIHRSLVELDRRLRAAGSMLVVRHGDPVREIPAAARALGCDAVYANRDYEPTARERDDRVRQQLAVSGIGLRTFKDQVVFEEHDILTREGAPYRVFTPYKRAWLERLHAPSQDEPPLREETPRLERCAPARMLRGTSLPWSLQDMGFMENAPLIPAGEREGERRLADFLRRIDRYGDERDVPALDATSGLSPHLRYGTVSIRRLVRQATARRSRGAQTWLSELIWREFYQMILFCYPHVARGAFRREYDGLRWPGRAEHLEAWRRGMTGYPLVDAAMRHFQATGWMHNRLRMVTAMFLTKDLLVHWQTGEAHFARLLLDYDLAANNGGWQWSASTGCDAQPYFRIFNSLLQSRRFDPDGRFIRAHCPELAGFSDRRIHWPHASAAAEQKAAGCLLGTDYPHPVVQHDEQRRKAMALFGKEQT